MPLTAAQTAAAKRAIDEELLRLCKRAGVKVGLPPADDSPNVGPFGHLQKAIKVVPPEKIGAALPGFENSWFENMLVAKPGPLFFPPSKEDLAKRKWKGITQEERALLTSGIGIVRDRGDEWLVLSKHDNGAALYRVRRDGLELLANTVEEFVQREVDRIVGEAQGSVTPTSKPPASNGLAKKIAKLRSAQTPASKVRAALIHGFVVEGMRSADDLVAVHELVEKHGLQFVFGFGDAENAEDGAFVSMPWVAGVELAAASGGAEQKRGVDVDARTLADAEKVVTAALKDARKLAKERGLSVGDAGVRLVASGGLCLAMLARGAWSEPPAKAKKDPDALSAWTSGLTWAADGVPGHIWGTRGATQDTYPGAVHGVLVAGTRDQDSVDIGARATSARDRALAKAGITDARYFLVTKFD